MPLLIQLVLVGMVLTAGWTDLRTRKIPNWIPVSGAIAGLVLHAYYVGLSGLGSSAAGAVLGFAVFFGLHLAGGMGAGDVKLFSAVGALTGPELLVPVFVFTGLAGGVAALAVAVFKGRLLETMRRTARLLMFDTSASSGQNGERLTLPYGAVIAFGTLVSLVIIH